MQVALSNALAGGLPDAEEQKITRLSLNVMEYYSGFLVPVKVTPSSQQRPFKQARRTKRSLQKELGSLEQRLRSIEGKLMLNRDRCESVSNRPTSQPKERPARVEYRIIENEYRDYNTAAENKKLREENKLLNQYFEVFSRKYRLNRNELELLRQENEKLKQQLDQNGIQRYREYHDEPEDAHTVRPATVHKYNYERPPYQQRSEFTGEPVKRIIKTHFKQSEAPTKNQDDSSMMDFPKTERSALKTARSGVL